MTIVNVYKSGPLQPKSVVILLHGYGANGEDLIGLASEWQDDLPDTLFLSPDAPDRCEINPSGRQWFTLENKSYATMQAGAESASVDVNQFIDETLEKYDLHPSKIALVGFSQGTMMSLYVAPRRTQPLAGVLGYSGLLLGVEGLSNGTAATRCPVCLVHGDNDMVVDIAAYDHALKTLEANSFQVNGHKIRGLGHGIDHQGLMIGRDFLKNILT